MKNTKVSWLVVLCAASNFVGCTGDEQTTATSGNSAPPTMEVEHDGDHDGIVDEHDNCTSTSNPDQIDGDADGLGDICDSCPKDDKNDIDWDGVCGNVDNCPGIANADQNDNDKNGIGDFCDVEVCDGVDNDGDGTFDNGFPDADGIGSVDCFDNDGDGQTELNGDCNDADPTIYAGNQETWFDGIDSNCNGEDNPQSCSIPPPSIPTNQTNGCGIDLQPVLLSVCGEDCDGTQIVLEIHNHGSIEQSDPIAMTIYGVSTLGQYVKLETKTVSGPFLPGQTNGGRIVEIGSFENLYGYSQIAISTDDDGSGKGVVNECDENNNRAFVSLAVVECPAPPVCEVLPPGFPVEADPTCEFQPTPGEFHAAIEWQKSFGVGAAGGVMSTPVVGNLTDDNGDNKVDGKDTPDIVYVELSGNLRAISGQDGTLLWTQPGMHTTYGSAALGDVDGDGKPEAFSLDASGKLRAFSNTGQDLWSCPVGKNSTYEYPAIADRDGDGQAEILVGNKICSSTGQLLQTTQLLHSQISFFADVDQDGQMEVVSGAGVSNFDGSTRFSLGSGFAAIGNFDADLQPEIVISGDGTVRLHDHDGTLLWSAPVPGGGNGGAPTIADFDGDGAPEIGVAGGTRYAVLEANGVVKWQNVTQDGSSNRTGSSVYDFNGDGSAEVVYADEQTLWIFKGENGQVLSKFDGHLSGTWHEYPVIADVDHDGHVEIILGSNPWFGQNDWNGITVLGDPSNNWTTGRPVWNQHAYHITNVGDDLSIPKNQIPNWISGNNTFRQGGFGSLGALAAADAKPVVIAGCDELCPAVARILFQVENRGANTIGAGLPWTIYGVAADGSRTKLVGSLMPDAIPPGFSSTTQEATLDMAIAMTYANLELVADDSGNGLGLQNECDELNNTASIPTLCSP